MAKVIFITGQSNSQGRAISTQCTAEELEYHNNSLIWDNGQFNPLKVGAYGNNQSTSGLHGLELPLTMNFKTQLPDETIYIVKYGVSGTSIDYHLLNGATYEAFRINCFQPAINWLLANGIEPEVFVYYSQGEADANAASYPNFNYKLSLLIENYRNILGSDIKFIFPEIIENGTLTHDTQINNVFKNYEKNDSNIFVINGKDYPSDDALHWNYEGVNLLGADLFNIVSQKKGCVIKYPLPYSFASENLKVISQSTQYIGNVNLKDANIIGFPFQNKGEVYIDTTLLNSSKSKLNNRYNPYCSLQDAINALPADDNTPWSIHFLKGGTVNGCELPFRNLEFISDKPLTIDFTNVNQEGQIISTTNPLANATNIISHTYLGENIKAISTYIGIQRFTNGSSFFKLQGNIAFDWKAQGGANSSFYTVQSKVPTTLVIREWYAYQTHGSYILGFADASNVTIKKLVNVDLSLKTTLRETAFNTLHNANIIIEHLDMVAGEFRTTVPVSIGKITGTGVVNSKSTRFVNCACTDGITFNNVNATYLEGILTSLNPWKGNIISDLLIKNFEGKASNIVLSGVGKVITRGNVSIDTTTLITSSVNDVVALEITNGITVINGVVKSNPASIIIEKGILKNNI